MMTARPVSEYIADLAARGLELADMRERAEKAEADAYGCPDCGNRHSPEDCRTPRWKNERGIAKIWEWNAKELAARVEKAEEERDKLKNALEGMCFQYIMDDGNGAGHLYIRNGERATWVMSSLFPDEWEDTGRGLKYIGGADVNTKYAYDYPG